MKKILFFVALVVCQMSLQAQWNTDRILSIGRNALYFEDYILSIQYFNQVVKIKPYLAEPYQYRGIAKIQLGDFKGADEDFTEAINRNPFESMEYYGRAIARLNLGFNKEAVADFTKALEFDPESGTLIQGRIEARIKCEDYIGAMDDLNHYIHLNPKNNSMYFEKGRILLFQKDTIGAEESFNKFIASDSTNAVGWSARGMLRLQRKDLKGALSDYSHAIKLNTNFSGDYINRGIINVESKNYKQALVDYDNAIRLDNSSMLAYYNRGLLRANLGDYNNALSDLKIVLELDTTNSEALLEKAQLEQTIGDHKSAIADYNKIIKLHSNFIPAYLSIAQSYQSTGNEKEAFRYRQLADKIEKNKDQIKKKAKEKEELAATNKIAQNSSLTPASLKTSLIRRLYRTTNGESDNNKKEGKYLGDNLRGQIQSKYADVVNEKNFELTYYTKSNDLRTTNLFYSVVEQFNKQIKASSPLKLTCNEVTLTSEMLNARFETINEITDKLTATADNHEMYFLRALNFNLAKDYKSALEDLNKCISYQPQFMLAYFCRADVRFKYLEYQKANEQNDDLLADKVKNDLFLNQVKIENQNILADYDKVIELNPDFSFAYYNKANMLCTQKDYKQAIDNYTKAIKCDNDFAEAYFNRGLTYLLLDEETKGASDLSKAGELGVYQSYNILKRLKKTDN